MVTPVSFDPHRDLKDRVRAVRYSTKEKAEIMKETAILQCELQLAILNRLDAIHDRLRANGIVR